MSEHDTRQEIWIGKFTGLVMRWPPKTDAERELCVQYRKVRPGEITLTRDEFIETFTRTMGKYWVSAQEKIADELFGKSLPEGTGAE